MAGPACFAEVYVVLIKMGGTSWCGCKRRKLFVNVRNHLENFAETRIAKQMLAQAKFDARLLDHACYLLVCGIYYQ